MGSDDCFRVSATAPTEGDHKTLDWPLALAGGEGTRLQDYVRRRFTKQSGVKVSLFAAVLAMHAPHVADADIKDDVYSDAKTVIEDLITKEIAETTVEEIACRAGHVKLSMDTGAPSVIRHRIQDR